MALHHPSRKGKMAMQPGPRRKTLIAASLVLALVGALPDRAGAGGATDELRPAIDKVLRILDDPALKGEAKTRERRAALRSVMESAIDFPEAARRALAAHWRARTEAEREEFVGLFKDLVTYSYIRLMEPYAGETVQIVGESPRHSTTCGVSARMVRTDPAESVFSPALRSAPCSRRYRVFLSCPRSTRIAAQVP